MSDSSPILDSIARAVNEANAPKHDLIIILNRLQETVGGGICEELGRIIAALEDWQNRDQ